MQQETIRKKFRINEGSVSPEPEVKLLAYTQVPPREGLSEKDRKKISDPRVIAGEAARTCYSKLCVPEAYLDEKHRAVTDEVIKSTRESGHLTTREHVNFTFGLSRVSRQVVWSLLHSHPHYDSDQQSQRYVTMKPGNFLVPDLSGEPLEIYEKTVNDQMKVYQELSKTLQDPAEEEYFRIFRARAKNREQYTGEIKKKAQEVARYVLPVATHTDLYHTISSLTLMRLARACDKYDAPTEARLVVSKMVEVVAQEVGTNYLEEIPDPIPLAETLEFNLLDGGQREVNLAKAKKATKEFDQGLGGHTSKLIGYDVYAPKVLGMAVRNVLGLSSDELSNEEAIRLVLDPQSNKSLGEVANITKVTKLPRSLETVSYTFAKKISHTGDSQDQRHRMTPAARPILSAHYTGEPDFITPGLIVVEPKSEDLYQQIMEQSFDAVGKLLKLGIPFEKAAYLLPNALALRFVEQGTLLNLHHKYRMRLCYSAQEEIWNASIDEAKQIENIHPEIGAWLMPPCTVRYKAGNSPFCPEGKRYCGVRVWNLEKDKYSRLI